MQPLLQNKKVTFALNKINEKKYLIIINYNSLPLCFEGKLINIFLFSRINIFFFF